jgi:hypothetical protein
VFEDCRSSGRGKEKQRGLKVLLGAEQARVSWLKEGAECAESPPPQQLQPLRRLGRAQRGGRDAQGSRRRRQATGARCGRRPGLANFLGRKRRRRKGL